MKPVKKYRSAVTLVTTLCLLLSVVPFFHFRLTDTARANGLSPISEMEGIVYAVTAGNNLINFNTATPSAINRSVPLTGLAQGETINSIDFRPRTGQLFAISSASRVYVINTGTGAATAVGAAFTPALNGTAIGLDFNPTVDRIRLVTDAEQNLRLNPDTGAVAATDSPLAYAQGDANANANPNIVGSAYTNNYNATTTTTLFSIDSNLDVLVRQGSPGGAPTSPNTGQLFTVGALGVNTTDQVGFDISAPGDLAFASLTPQSATTSSFYAINLNTGAATLVGPIGGTDIVRDIAVVTRVETIFAVNANNELLSFNSGTPGAITTRTITGLQGGESVLGIDFRPATGQLFALTNASRVYTLNTTTGAATPVGGAPLATPLNGTAYGFDFNPVPDRIRVVSDAEQNLRLNPNNGAIAGVDTPLAYAQGDANAGANPNVVASAYTSNIAGTTTTTLYGIDSERDALVLQGSLGGTPNSPNGGSLTTVGALTVNTTDQVGFDIAPQTGAAFASLTLAGATTSGLYAVNLTSGAVTLLAPIGGGAVIRDIAVATRVELTYAVTASNTLISFNALTPGTILSTAPITGLSAGENIVGIDFRPAGGQLFALSTANIVYTINPLTGFAAPAGPAFAPALAGTSFGFDFNPVPDRIRVVSDADQNLRLNPNNGALAGTDTALAYASGDANANANPNVVAVAYTNNFAGTPSTTLFGVDSNLDILVRQGSPGGAPNSPNGGQLSTIGPLGVNTTNDAGFDISDCGNGYLSLTTAGATQSQLYTINLTTGAATAIGAVGVNEVVRDITVATTFVPSAQQAGLAAVNAASFASDTLAPDTITALFGSFQTTGGQIAIANTLPVPTTLGGVTVAVNGVNAGLFFVSNSQINFRVPSSVADGQALITVTNANGTTRAGFITINRTAPGLFTLNASGTGIPAGFSTVDGVNFTGLANPDGTARAVDPGTAAKPTYLVLFGTGLRNARADNPTDANGVAEAVTATIQGIPAAVSYAGRHPDYEGLDQINLVIPPQLAGTGMATLRLVVNGRASNEVAVRIGGTAPTITTESAALGQTIGGSLSSTDQVLRGGDGRTYFFDAYRFSAAAGTGVAIDARSTVFDVAVLLYRAEAGGALTLVAADDDLGGLGDGDIVNGNALLLSAIQQTGDYVVFVTSASRQPGALGGYSLRLVGNAIQSLSYGANVNGSIAAGDLQTSAGDFLDAYWFAGVAGDRVQLRMNATNFDSLLLLNKNNGDTVGADDNSGGGQDALLSQTLSETGVYVVIATPFAPNRTGNYTLSLTRVISAVTGLGETEGASVAPARVVSLARAGKGELTHPRFAEFAARAVIER